MNEEQNINEPQNHAFLVGAVSGRFSIWSTECPSCKTGRVLLFEKGGSGKCDKCKRTFFTDYEDHPELGTPQTEYWLVD